MQVVVSAAAAQEASKRVGVGLPASSLALNWYMYVCVHHEHVQDVSGRELRLSGTLLAFPTLGSKSCLIPLEAGTAFSKEIREVKRHLREAKRGS